VLDFGFFPPRAKLLDTVLALYRDRGKFEGSTMFNYKTGVK
jgi:hypothetical protein